MTTGGVWCADVNFLGSPGTIAAGVMEGRDGIVLVDPGPASSLAGLGDALAARGRSFADVRAVLITHIHLDHSGAIGALVREVPSIRVFVHQRGAPHIIDPTRVLASARRVFGDRTDHLWGEVVPVPAGRVTVLMGGEQVDVVGRAVRVEYTPGHAVHHVCFFDESSGVAFTGDVGGMALAGTTCALPPAPPPDIDLEQWRASLVRIRAWRPRALLLAHFGFVEPADRHLEELEQRLLVYAGLVRDTLGQQNLEDADRVERFREAVRADLRRTLSAERALAVERGYVVENSWHGLARYWRKRWEREGTA